MSLILVIEDDKDIRDSIMEVLEVEGYEVMVASNGQEGLDLLRSNSGLEPAAILLDLMMPIMNGMQFRKNQLLDKRLAKIPVIVMSADNRAVQKSEEMRSTICILKPLEIDDLISALNRLLVA